MPLRGQIRASGMIYRNPKSKRTFADLSRIQHTTITQSDVCTKNERIAIMVIVYTIALLSNVLQASLKPTGNANEAQKHEVSCSFQKRFESKSEQGLVKVRAIV